MTNVTVSAALLNLLKHSSTVRGGVKPAERTVDQFFPGEQKERNAGRRGDEIRDSYTGTTAGSRKHAGVRISSMVGGHRRRFARFTGLLLACVFGIASTTSSLCLSCGSEGPVPGSHTAIGSLGHSDGAPDCDRNACSCCGFHLLLGSFERLPKMTPLCRWLDPGATRPQPGWFMPLYRPPRA